MPQPTRYGYEAIAEKQYDQEEPPHVAESYGGARQNVSVFVLHSQLVLVE